MHLEDAETPRPPPFRPRAGPQAAKPPGDVSGDVHVGQKAVGPLRRSAGRRDGRRLLSRISG